MNAADHPDVPETLATTAVAVTVSLTPIANALTEESAPLASSIPRLAADPPGGGNTPQVQPGGDDDAAAYLYFLVCEAEVGPLAGLFKLGITERVKTRYHQHQQVWGTFDLRRSALLRLDNRWEARRIELALRDVFGGPAEDGSTESVAKPTVARSWRRFPGRHAEGHTEFYTTECLDRMLAFTEAWLAFCGERMAGFSLQRGIDPAVCEWIITGGAPPFDRDGGPGLRERHRILREREYQELEEQVIVKMTLVLNLALMHEERLLWVDLRGWQQRRNNQGQWFDCGGSLVDLYFAHFGSASDADERQEQESLARARFEESVDLILAKATSPGPQPWRRVRSRRVCSLCEMDGWLGQSLPQPHCAGALRLRVEPELSGLDHPLYEQFEVLARRVEGRFPQRQQEFPW